jgi:ATP-dependent Clp protease ATP-binding subunit ClpA
MNGVQFTDRANKALLDSSGLCEQYSQSQIMPVHLAVALLNPSPDESEDQQTPSGAHSSHDSATAPLFRQVVERAHGDAQLLDRSLMKLLVRLPSQDPPPENPSVSPQLSKVIRSATDLSKTQKDSFVAVDHLIQSVCQDSQVQRALGDANIPTSS